MAYTGATETALDKVYNDNPDCQKIGASVNPQVHKDFAREAARRYLAIYSPRAKLDVAYEPDAAKVRWRKMAYNGTFYVVSSILKMDTPRICMSKHIIGDLILPLIEEIRTIAKVDGITLRRILSPP